MNGRAYWEELERPAPDSVRIGDVEVRRGSRVRLKPRRSADVFDLALADRVAVVEEVVEGFDGVLQLAVTVEDDPGRDLGQARQIGHRFFFSTEEVEPLGDFAAVAQSPWLLVAGIGNVFLGDDGFGVAVAERLARSAPRPGVHVEDFGIRGMDLAYALEEYEVALLIDAVPRGETPGTLYVIEAALDDDEGVAADAHGMDPVAVLALARRLGGRLPRVLVVGCEPAIRMTGDEPDVVADLSEPVRAAVDGAVRLVESLIDDLQTEREAERTQQ
jgi:hydrogenase maturation protease